MTTLHTLRQTLSRWIDTARTRRQLKRELAQLAAMGSLDAVLGDVGLARSQVGPMVAHGAQSGDQLDRMLARLGLDAAQLAPETRRDMTWTCLNCPDKRQCRRWMAGRDIYDFHSFCPNADELDHALSDQGVAPPDGPYRPTADELQRLAAERRQRETRILLDSIS